MAVDRSFVEQNRAVTARMKKLIAGLSDADFKRPVGEHWDVSVTLAHLAFWDERVLNALDASEREGKVVAPTIDIAVNDIMLPLLKVIPPPEAARLAIETAEKLDQRLENLSPELLEQIAAFNMRYLNRALHRALHLDEVEQALK
ncbi:MAG: maleylpyruvate isomerase N-terminal domain-containing protein [Chloroflexota bacterium]